MSCYTVECKNTDDKVSPAQTCASAKDDVN